MIAAPMTDSSPHEPHPIDRHSKKGFMNLVPSLFPGRPRSSSNASSPSTSRDVSSAPSVESKSSRRRGGQEETGGLPSSSRPAVPQIYLLVDGCSPPPLSPRSRARALPIVGSGGAQHSPAHNHSPLDPTHSLESSLSLSHLDQSTSISSSPPDLSPTKTPPSSSDGPPVHDASVHATSSSLPNPTSFSSSSPTNDPAAPPVTSTVADPVRPKTTRHATPVVVSPSAATRRPGRKTGGVGGCLHQSWTCAEIYVRDISLVFKLDVQQQTTLLSQATNELLDSARSKASSLLEPLSRYSSNSSELSSSGSSTTSSSSSSPPLPLIDLLVLSDTPPLRPHRQKKPHAPRPAPQRKDTPMYISPRERGVKRVELKSGGWVGVVEE
ncbi:hypothetical protein BDY24DRAFT_442601 [Mrakia frigida]|uniref:uncharacterized protein n=1 Tax=Mrakia frigida TaxID=29902 RepID=UPI003FCC159C